MVFGTLIRLNQYIYRKFLSPWVNYCLLRIVRNIMFFTRDNIDFMPSFCYYYSSNSSKYN